MRFGSTFLEQKLNLFHRLYFNAFGLPDLGNFIRKRNIEALLARHSLNPSKILDLGCGSGDYSVFLAEKFWQAQVLGIDKKLRARGLEKFVKKNRINNLSFSKTRFFSFRQKGFDFVFSVEVFEHFASLGKALKKTASLMKSSGFLLIHVPSSGWEKFEFFQKRDFPNYFRFLEKKHRSRAILLETLSGQLEKSGFKLLFAKKTFGTIARLCWETDLLLIEKKMFSARTIFLPLFKALSFFDPYFKNENGKGILVLAQKVSG